MFRRGNLNLDNFAPHNDDWLKLPRGAFQIVIARRNSCSDAAISTLTTAPLAMTIEQPSVCFADSSLRKGSLHCVHIDIIITHLG